MRLIPYWSWYSHHSPEWWARLWRFSQYIEVEVSDLLPDGFDVWLHWEEIRKATFNNERTEDSGDMKLLKADKGNFLTFGRTVGRKEMKRW